ncbi:lipoprotein insertase outer membrane protein LolB [Granulosicoccus antarcticus]|uniref:Outer-membrane lipoprotein LolB n=1 Tax=Granulosicoccus antarcticus IMCC3135 TaxID=1192854 RepID=A0A2Z2NQH0_9GAMM|nr:lipoprotein insertase outer membrane protein LolB [Granulosicoccus antarcticus]ASJ72231.1 Outer-membrane lipoprotein LolB [Granulosicoccus antarcticus IMCC3135]
MSTSLRQLLLPALVCLSSVLLSACQSMGMTAPEGTDSKVDEVGLAASIKLRESVLGVRNDFRVEGGLGIWTDTETISARLDWQQKSDELDLTLSGPLGIGTMQLTDDGSLVTLSRGGARVGQGPVADDVLQKGLGLSAPVPLDELGFWVKGLPGNATAVSRDAQGRLVSLRYTDVQGTRWQARFLRYVTWDKIEVPELITASGGPYSVRLRLKNWRYNTTTVVPDRPELNNRLPIPGR